MDKEGKQEASPCEAGREGPATSQTVPSEAELETPPKEQRAESRRGEERSAA